MKICYFSMLLCIVYAHKAPLVKIAKIFYTTKYEQPRLNICAFARSVLSANFLSFGTQLRKLARALKCQTCFLPKWHWRPYAQLLFSHDQVCTAMMAALPALLKKYKTCAYFDGTARQSTKNISYRKLRSQNGSMSNRMPEEQHGGQFWEITLTLTLCCQKLYTRNKLPPREAYTVNFVEQTRFCSLHICEDKWYLQFDAQTNIQNMILPDVK